MRSEAAPKRPVSPAGRSSGGGHGGWRSLAQARLTWHAFRESWTDVALQRRKRFLVVLAWGWAAAGLLTAALALLGRSYYSRPLEALEEGWLERIVEAAPIGYEMAVFLESPGNGPVLVPLTLAAAILFSRSRRPLLSLSTLASTLMPAAVVGLGWLIWERERPDFLYPGLPEQGMSAFPSGHLAMAIPFYGFLAYLWVRGSQRWAERVCAALLVAALATTIGLARLVLSAHWPSDLLAGGILGAGWLALVIAALRSAEAPRAAPH